MSYTKAFCTTLFLFVAIITHVHAEEPVAEQKAVVLANVNIYKSAIVSSEGGQLTVGFDVANSGTVAQGDIRYGVDVVKATPQGQTIVDSFVADETLALAPQSTVHKSLAYTIPASLQGEYEIWVIARTSSGMMLGLGRAGTTTLVNTAPYIALVPETCAITVSGETDHYTLYQGVDVSPLETLSLVCTLESHFGTDTTVTPAFSTHRRTTYGALVDTAPVTPEPITLKAGEKKTASFTIPKAIAPQAYDVSLVLQNGEKREVSNKIVAHYVLRGPSATIQTATLDKVSYAQGDTLNALIRWTPSADSFLGAREKATTLTTTTLALSVTDKNGTACIAPMTQLLTTQELTLTAPVTTPCIEPVLSLTLSDGNGTILDSRTIASPVTPPQPVVASEPMTEKTSIWTLKFLIIFITTLSALILLYVLIKVRATMRGEVILKSLIFTFVFAASCLSGVGEVRAETVGLTLHGEHVSTYTYNHGSNFDVGEPIVINTSVVGALSNSFEPHASMTATLNGQTIPIFDNKLAGANQGTLYGGNSFSGLFNEGVYTVGIEACYTTTESAFSGCITQTFSITIENQVTEHPIGVFESASCSVVTGWACDQDNQSKALTVEFYNDSDKTLLWSTVANIDESDATISASCGGTTAHRFRSDIPVSLKDGISRTISAYALNTYPVGGFLYGTHILALKEFLVKTARASAYPPDSKLTGVHQISCPPDLSAQNISPNDGSIIKKRSKIMFTGEAVNSSEASIANGGRALIEFDHNGDEHLDEERDAVQPDGQMGAFTANQIKQLSYEYTDLPIGNHAYRFNIDSGNTFLESNELNNISPWRHIKIIDGDVSASKTNALYGESVRLEWATQNTDGLDCQIAGGPLSSPLEGQSGGGDTGPLEGGVTTYTLSCDGVLLGAVNITVITLPELSLTQRVMEKGSTTVIEWNTHNGDEGACTLQGGQESDLIPETVGDPNIGSVVIEVKGRTKYTLTCPQGSANITVEILPTAYES